MNQSQINPSINQQNSGAISNQISQNSLSTTQNLAANNIQPPTPTSNTTQAINLNNGGPSSNFMQQQQHNQTQIQPANSNATFQNPQSDNQSLIINIPQNISSPNEAGNTSPHGGSQNQSNNFQQQGGQNQNVPNNQPAHSAEISLCVDCFLSKNFPNMMTERDFVKMDIIAKMTTDSSIKNNRPSWLPEETL